MYIAVYKTNMKDSTLSYSSLKAFAKSPNHFIHYKTRPQPDAAHFAFGRAVHGYVLERDQFEENFAVSPKFDKRTKVGKEGFAEFSSQVGERQVIDESDLRTIQAINFAIDEHIPATDLLSNTEREMHLHGDIDGVPFHGFGDAVNIEAGFCLDLKTCRDSSPESFMRDAHNLDYHLQAAVYRALFGVDRFYWIAVEKEAPFNVTVFMQSEDAANKSDHYLNTLLTKWKAWDGKSQPYSNEVLTLDLPRWA